MAEALNQESLVFRYPETDLCFLVEPAEDGADNVRILLSLNQWPVYLSLIHIFIDIITPSQKTVEALSRLEMTAGVQIDIKMK